MSAIRLPLLCAFAGGCLSNAVLFALWRPAEGAGVPAVQSRGAHYVVDERATVASAALGVTKRSELAAAAPLDHGRGGTSEAAPTPAASDPDSVGSTLAGSAVSDVLTRLEAAYRERAVAPASPPPSTRELALAAAPAASVVAAGESAPAPARPAAQSTPALPAISVVTTAPVVPVPAAIVPAATVPAATVPAATAALMPQVAPGPARAAQDAPPPTEIHYGDVNQNTYVTNVRQGDTYLIQQVALLQYLQLLGIPSGLTAQPRAAGGLGHSRGALSSGITNPDNPWGFHIAPPNLVR